MKSSKVMITFFSSSSLLLASQLLLLLVPPDAVDGYAVLDIRQDEKAKLLHRLDTLNILAYVSILILIVCTIWLFKHKRVKFIHETGLAIIYGLVVGAIIRYAGKDTEVSQLSVIPKNITSINSTIKYGPPDMLWIEFNVPAGVKEDVNGRFIHNTAAVTGVPALAGNDSGIIIGSNSSSKQLVPAVLVPVQPGNTTSITPSGKDTTEARSYAYVFQGEIYNPKTDGSRPQNTKILEKATFDPEIFFNLILPLIVFNAGYSLKRKFFFRNFGAIMTYAFFGTTISCFIVACVMKTLGWFMPTTLAEFSFSDFLYFGAIISATDPVTVLAIFNDIRVDVTLHALVFGESIFNDVICIVLASSIDSFTRHYAQGFFLAVYTAFTNFLYIFIASLIQGSLIGCATALLTKYTKLCDHPLLESTLFVLCSYASFLLAEAFELSGIVSVLFCGICQAHYTYNNLSPESRVRTKSLFEMCNFIAENFIFAYIGVSIFTFPQHLWSFWFILWTFIAIILGRALNVYPLSYFLNLGRTNKIPLEFQHVLFVSGLRGAMAFALAIRNTLTEPRRLMLTSTSIVSITSVIFCGSSIQPILAYFSIPTNVDEAVEHNSSGFGAGNDAAGTSFDRFRNRSGSADGSIISPVDDLNIGSPGSNSNLITGPKGAYEKAWLVRKWYNFDSNFMKPLLTHARPSLMETMPACCLPVARLLTSEQQMREAFGVNNNNSLNNAGQHEQTSMIITQQPQPPPSNGAGSRQKVPKTRASRAGAANQSSDSSANTKSYQSIY